MAQVVRKQSIDQGVRKPKFVTILERYRPLYSTIVFPSQVKLRCKT